MNFSQLHWLFLIQNSNGFCIWWRVFFLELQIFFIRFSFANGLLIFSQMLTLLSGKNGLSFFHTSFLTAVDTPSWARCVLWEECPPLFSVTLCCLVFLVHFNSTRYHSTLHTQTGLGSSFNLDRMTFIHMFHYSVFLILHLFSVFLTSITPVFMWCLRIFSSHGHPSSGRVSPPVDIRHLVRLYINLHVYNIDINIYDRLWFTGHFCS